MKQDLYNIIEVANTHGGIIPIMRYSGVV